MNERLFEGQVAERATSDPQRRAELKQLARELVVIVRQGLVEDGMVRIHGFGTFRLSPSKPRTATNPHTGERMQIPARHRVLFRPAKALRERIEPDPGQTVVLGEPLPSREASLGGSMEDEHAAGRLPEDVVPESVTATAAGLDQPRNGDSEQLVVAAEVREPVLRAHAPPPPPPPDEEEPDPEPSPEPEYQTQPQPEIREPVVATPMPLGIDAPETPHAETSAAPREDETPNRRRQVLLAVLLLLLLLGALAWWLWPMGRDQTIPLATTPIESTEPPAEATIAEPVEPTVPESAATEPAEPAATEPTDPAPAEPAPADTAPAPAPETVPESLSAAASADAATAEQLGDQPVASAGEAWFTGQTYEVVPGDTLWGLANRNYINPFIWPHIYNHNDGVANPDRIHVGQEIQLPTLYGDPRELADADRRSIAEGYLRLYEFWRATGQPNAHYALVGVEYFDPNVLPPDS